jgi:hypothetical protein
MDGWYYILYRSVAQLHCPLVGRTQGAAGFVDPMLHPGVQKPAEEEREMNTRNAALCTNT